MCTYVHVRISRETQKGLPKPRKMCRKFRKKLLFDLTLRYTYGSPVFPSRENEIQPPRRMLVLFRSMILQYSVICNVLLSSIILLYSNITPICYKRYSTIAEYNPMFACNTHHNNFARQMSHCCHSV